MRAAENVSDLHASSVSPHLFASLLFFYFNRKGWTAWSRALISCQASTPWPSSPSSPRSKGSAAWTRTRREPRARGPVNAPRHPAHPGASACGRCTFQQYVQLCFLMLSGFTGLRVKLIKSIRTSTKRADENTFLLGQGMCWFFTVELEAENVRNAWQHVGTCLCLWSYIFTSVLFPSESTWPVDGSDLLQKGSSSQEQPERAAAVQIFNSTFCFNLKLILMTSSVDVSKRLQRKV